MTTGCVFYVPFGVLGMPTRFATQRKSADGSLCLVHSFSGRVSFEAYAHGWAKIRNQHPVKRGGDEAFGKKLSRHQKIRKIILRPDDLFRYLSKLTGKEVFLNWKISRRTGSFNQRASINGPSSLLR